MIYRASAPCGCVVAAVVDGLSNGETARNVADYVRRGLAVDRVEEVSFTRCEQHRDLDRHDWIRSLRMEEARR